MRLVRYPLSVRRVVRQRVRRCVGPQRPYAAWLLLTCEGSVHRRQLFEQLLLHHQQERWLVCDFAGLITAANSCWRSMQCVLLHN